MNKIMSTKEIDEIIKIGEYHRKEYNKYEKTIKEQVKLIRKSIKIKKQQMEQLKKQKKK